MKPDDGTIRWGTGVDIGYYDQHQAGLQDRKTVLEEVWERFPRMEQYEVRGALGMFLFTGDEVFAPVSTLSGGERGRVALTELMLRKDNVLLLDEPTNHLDMDSREVLEEALSEFPGTIIAISHDRYFINRFAEKVCVLSEQGLAEYLGNYDDYFEKVNREQEPDGAMPERTRTAIDKEKKKSRDEERRARELKERIGRLEKEIDETEKEISRLEGCLADPSTWQDREFADRTGRDYRDARERLEQLYAEWEQLNE